jgi:hypothetical protein
MWKLKNIPKFQISKKIYCRKTDENDLFVELDNNKQVEQSKKS